MLRRISDGTASWLPGLALAATLVTVTPVAGHHGVEAPESQIQHGEWEVISSPFADLWYHGLAVVGFHGLGLHPLYDVAYGRRIVRGNPDAPLSQVAPRVLERLQADPAFEVLHFLPVYLAEASPEQALAGLRRIATSPGGEVPRLAGPGARGTEALAALLPDPRQRQTLGELVDALQSEWESGLKETLSEARASRADQLGRIRAHWQGYFAPALAPYLEAYGLASGWIVATPALGLEGRFLHGDDSGGQTVVVIGLGPSNDDPDAILAPVVRELCYPAVRRAFEQLQSRYDDRMVASRASDAAATRCGELLLERYRPEALPSYRSRFGLQGPHDSAFSSLPDPAEALVWNEALGRVLNLLGGS
ncbi:MAG: hypothetical protein JSU98_11300 [Gemmatimonadales bacterium]|nr:MAG: hypothetical protein JSU98_11300 [Gemmatimonadales bacterium]